MTTFTHACTFSVENLFCGFGCGIFGRFTFQIKHLHPLNVNPNWETKNQNKTGQASVWKCESSLLWSESPFIEFNLVDTIWFTFQILYLCGKNLQFFFSCNRKKLQLIIIKGGCIFIKSSKQAGEKPALETR